jgi:hypothetical protein
MQWNNNANVCGGTQVIAKPMARPNQPHVTTRQRKTLRLATSMNES